MEFGELVVTKNIALGQGKKLRIGDECFFLGLASPYSYVTKKTTYVYSVTSDNILRDILQFNTGGIVALKEQASQKMKRMTQLARDKDEKNNIVINSFNEVRAANEKNEKLMERVSK